MAEHVILFSGPMGAGKSRAIRTLSEIEPVSTEAANTDRATADKATTTVALDYGEITIGTDEKVRLYGLPGQKRFDFMWDILKERAIGTILLVNNDAADPLGSVVEFLGDFRELHENGAVVVGITRTDVAPAPFIGEYAAAIASLGVELPVPVFTVDARNRAHLEQLLMTLILNIETRASITQGAVAL